MKRYYLAKLERDLEIAEKYLRMAIEATGTNEKDKFLFLLAQTLDIDVEDLK